MAVELWETAGRIMRGEIEHVPDQDVPDQDNEASSDA